MTNIRYVKNMPFDILTDVLNACLFTFDFESKTTKKILA